MTFRRLPENLRRYAKSLARAAVAMSFGLGDLLAGGVLAANLEVVRSIPWAVTVYPGMLSARGAVNGVLSGRLSTGLNLGSIRPSLRRNTEEFWATISAAFALTLLASSSLTLTLGSSLMLTGWYDSRILADLLIVITASMGVSQLIMAPATSLASFAFFKLGIDPDYVTYPSMSTVADFVVSAVYVGLLRVFRAGWLGRVAVLALALGFAASTVALAFTQRGSEGFRSVLREASMSILGVSLIVTLTGNLLLRVERRIGEVRSIYLVYPALLTMVGDFGSIVGSVATTRLALGTARAGAGILLDVSPEATGAWTAWFVASQAFGLIAAAFGGGGRFFWLATVLGVSGILSTLAVTAIALIVAILTFRMGLDPDNFVNPIESSLADVVTTGSLLLALTLLPPA